MKKIASFSLIFCSLAFIFYILKPIKRPEQHLNLFQSFSLSESQDQHDKDLKRYLTDCFNIKLGVVYEMIYKKIISRSDYLVNLQSNVVKKHFSCSNGSFQIQNDDTLLKVKEFSLKFRITDSKNYYLLKIFIKPLNKISLIRVENGMQKPIKTHYTLLSDSRNIRDDIFIFYFKKYLFIMNGDRLIAFYSCLDNSISGGISYSSLPDTNSFDVTVRHSPLDALSVTYLEQELIFSRLISDFPAYHWNTYYPQHLIPFNAKKHEFIQRVELGNITKPSILIPSGAKATWNLEVRGISKLRVSLALVDKYIFNPERILFKINIKSKLNPALIVTDKIDWSSLVNHQWKDLNIDLSDFSGKNITISFQTEIMGTKLPIDDNIVSIWGSPEIITQKTPDEKNVILFILDAVRPDHLSCYGYDRKTSPTIDALARSGVIFKSAITAATWTLPSHMSIFSGLYPSECGYNPDTFNNKIIPQSSFPALGMEIRTMAEYLSDYGYSTTAFTGGGILKPEYNFDQGFHHFEHLNNDKDMRIQISSAIDWIRNNLKNKFFLTIHTYDTHCPYTHNIFNSSKAASPEIKAIESYDSGILFADNQMKLVIDFLKSAGIFNDTLIIVMSDHGENFNPNQLKINEGNPCGSHGETLYDCELKIPLILTGAGIPSAGMVIDEQVRTVDILPTILDILHIETEHNFRGRSLLPLMKGKMLPIAIAYSEGVRATSRKICNIFSIRTNKYKLIKNVITHCTLSQPEYELYDLENDPEEKTNLKDLLPSVLNKLTNIMISLRMDMKYFKANHVKGNFSELQKLGYIDN